MKQLVRDIHLKERLSVYFSKSAITTGAIGTSALFLLIGLWLYLIQGNVETARLQRLASKTILIDHSKSITSSFGLNKKTTIGKSAPLVTAPAHGLYKSTADNAVLPIINQETGQTVFETYRREPDQLIGGKPTISLILMDYGLSYAASESALRTMNPNISFALSPYSIETNIWQQEARLRGHEIWLILPAETENFPQSDSGEDALLIGLSKEENNARFLNTLQSATGYVGLIPTYNAVTINSSRDFHHILKKIYDRGLGFIQSGPKKSIAIEKIALNLDRPHAYADLLIDNIETPEAIQNSLETLEQNAIKNGSAIGLFRPLPASYLEVNKWIDSLERKNIILVPASEPALKK